MWLGMSISGTIVMKRAARIGHEIGVVLLRVEPASAATDGGAAAVRGQIRPRRDLDAPALIV